MTPPRSDRCSVLGCREPSHRRGWCTSHYERWRRTGTTRGRPSLSEREVIRLRHELGIPDDGPTDAQVERWIRQEAHP